ncbi:hypothetical protein MP228_007233 [Amoeboaphelidium protococcarum]|nr:hypothetical protein MP228_007233 [Amoeboaphelidium protococcarum]
MKQARNLIRHASTPPITSYSQENLVPVVDDLHDAAVYSGIRNNMRTPNPEEGRELEQPNGRGFIAGFIYTIRRLLVWLSNGKFGDSYPTSQSGGGGGSRPEQVKVQQIKKLREEYRSRRVVRVRGAEGLLGYSTLRRFKRFLDDIHSLYAILLAQILIDTMICLIYLINMETSGPWPDNSRKFWYITRTTQSYYALLVFAYIQVLLSCIRIVTKPKSLFRLGTLIDLITIVPFVVTPFLKDGEHIWVPYFLRIWNLQAAVNALLLLQLRGSTVLNQMMSQIIVFVLRTTAFVFTWMCGFQFFEMQFGGPHYGIVDSLYFVIISSATVGYGDITPETMLGRILCVVMIILAIVFFPSLISGIVETYKSQKEGHKTFVGGSSPFVIVCLSFTQNQFVREILTQALTLLSEKKHFKYNRNQHADKLGAFQSRFKTVNSILETTSYQIVILSPHKPTHDIKQLLNSLQYRHRIAFIQGSALEENDLRRCSLRQASACFVIADRSKGIHLSDGIEEDRRNVLRVWSIRKFSSKTPVYAFNIRPETDLHVRPLVKQVVCVNSIKQMILGISCIHKGASALITNLIHSAPRLKKYNQNWQVQYGDGLCNVIRLSPFNMLFCGKRYSDVCWFLYAEFQVILIGVKFRIPAKINASQANIKTPNNESTVYTYCEHLVLNPGPDFIFPENDLVEKIISVCSCIEDLADIERLDKQQFQSTWQKWFNVQDDLDQSFPSHSQRQNRQSDSCQCDMFGQSGELDSDVVDAGNLTESIFLNRRSSSKLHQESPQSSSSTANRFQSASSPAKSTSRLASLRYGTDSLPTLSPDGSQSVNVDADLEDQSADSEQLANIYVGHPRPPHHLVIDNDLQSPFCYMVKQIPSIEQSRLADASVNQDFNIDADVSHGRGHKAASSGNYNKLKGHVILCANNFEVWTFMCTVRASFLDKSQLTPILILCPQLPSEDEWRSIAVFPHVYFMQGSSLKRNDLIKAGLFDCSCVIVLQQPLEQSKIDGGDDERFVDSAAVMTAHQIDFMTKDKYVITELVTRNNIKFMRVKHEMLECLPKLTSKISPEMNPIDITYTMRKYTFRRTVPEGALNTNLSEWENDDENFAQKAGNFSQSNQFNAQIAESMDESHVNTEDPGYYAHSAVYASGRVLTGDMYDGLIFEAFRTPAITDVVKLLCGRRYQRWRDLSNHLNVVGSVLKSVRVPPRLVGMSFAQVFRHLSLEHQCVVLGIYRNRTRADVEQQFSELDQQLHGSLKKHKDLRDQSSTIHQQQYTSQRHKNLPVHRTRTNVSTWSPQRQHLYQIDSNYTMNLGDVDALEMQNITHKSYQESAQKTQRIQKLLLDMNHIDNDLPYLITNPLPDLIIDSMDDLFLLVPESSH